MPQSQVMKFIVVFLLLISSVKDLSASSPKEMFRLKEIFDVQLSPDNRSILFVVKETTPENEFLFRIHKSDVDNQGSASALTSGFSNQPRWSPDGKWISFISTGNGTNQLFLISAEGGEPIMLTTGRYEVQTYAWSPDGQTIAFVMADEMEKEKNKAAPNRTFIYKEPRLINRLWLIEPFASDVIPKILTNDDYCVCGKGDFKSTSAEFDWSPDSKTIVFSYTSSPELDDFNHECSLASIEIATEQITAWEKKASHESQPRYSPNGQWVAYLSGNQPQKYARVRLAALRSKEGSFVRFLSPTFDEFSPFATLSILGWSPENSHIFYFEPKHTRYHIAALPIDGSAAQEIDLQGCFIKAPSLSFDKTKLAFVGQSPSVAPEAYVSKLKPFEPRQISNLNQSVPCDKHLKTEVISWKSTDGLNIEGLLTYPKDYQTGKRYPLLVVIHGGPMMFFDETFLGTPSVYPLTSFADAGFVVFRPNPRGSCGYGRSFRCANYSDWGGMDFQDVMTGVDALISKGIADEKKMGVMGWSYGGYLTAWIISQTSRFKAASLGAGVYNLISQAGTMDLSTFISDYLGKFFDHPEFFQKRSPIYHVRQITSACLLQHGLDDKRVPVSQSYEFYHALEAAGKNPTLILYPETEHQFADPQLLLDAMERNLAWFKQELLN